LPTSTQQPRSCERQQFSPFNRIPERQWKAGNVMQESQIQEKARARIPTEVGEFWLYLYTGDQDDKQHLALVMGDVDGEDEVLVRVHSECFTGDVLGSQRCDCGEQLQAAVHMIAEEGKGVLIYLRQEGRGIGLIDKLRAYNLQDIGYDTVDANLLLGHQADERDYSIAALILKQLRVQSVMLLTNNPSKIEGLRNFGIQVTDRVPLPYTYNDENEAYLTTKQLRMNHHTNETPTPEMLEGLRSSKQNG
jgi:3,4-dihydroxy 2-butanone 4-phosphate synthase/GTP cyclohydrolase II